MRRKLLPIVGFGLLATLMLVIGLVVSPERRDILVDLYLLSLGGIAAIRLVTLLRRRLGPGEVSEFEEALRPRDREPVRVAELDKLAREVELGTATAFDFHFRLRPTLIEIARNRLAARGVALETPRARSILGEDAWELLRPDREQPRNRNAPGISRADLQGVVLSLERIA